MYQSTYVIDTKRASFNELVFPLHQRDRNEREVDRDILEHETQLQNRHSSTSVHNSGINIRLRHQNIAQTTEDEESLGKREEIKVRNLPQLEQKTISKDAVRTSTYTIEGKFIRSVKGMLPTFSL